jgi:hypothetical protein
MVLSLLFDGYKNKRMGQGSKLLVEVDAVIPFLAFALFFPTASNFFFLYRGSVVAHHSIE